MPATPRLLTPKQQRFVAEYLIDLNATEAAKRAGYSVRTAYSVGHENLKKPEIAAAIAVAQAERSERTQITADRVLQELARVAFLDPRKVMTWGPDGVTFTASEDLDDDTAACVAEASQTVTEAGGSIKVKLCNKIQALTLLGQHLGIYKHKVEVTENSTLVLVEEIVDGHPDQDATTP